MDKRIAFLKKQMLSNLRHSPTIEKMARLVNLSESHLRQFFKREVGMSPVQNLKDLRLEKAKKLLENTFLRVKEIQFETGIKDQSHFVKDFKKKYGLTPAEYRRQHQVEIGVEKSYTNKS
ncbi:MAG TPA: AraC family transcriptional regulator [Pyrinomonadaceae bacterium]|nr:AraC family transcriptional regulator [Pyrinomonadaceae bacterium]